MAGIFLSYSHDDRGRASEIAAALERDGFDLFWDRKLKAGANFERTLDHEIQKAQCVLVLWSEQSIQSDWVRAEALDGFERGRLVPVMLTPVRLPLAFKAQSCIDLSRAQLEAGDPEYDRLCENLAGVLSGEISTGQATPLGSRAMTLPSIAVLPLRAVSPSPDMETLSIGITFEVIATLARMPGFFVIDFNSMSYYMNREVNATQIGRELGVQYVVQGTVIPIGDNVRVMMELVEAAARKVIWSDTLVAQRSVEDITAMQETLSGSIAARVAPGLHAAERARSTRLPTDDLAAWELVSRARSWRVGRGTDTKAEKEQMAMLERAIELDPNYVDAIAIRAQKMSFQIVMGQTHLTTEVLASVERALTLEPDNEFALVECAICYFHLRDWERAMRFLERALQLNRNHANAWAHRGLTMLATSPQDTQEALSSIHHALELSPNDELTFMWHHYRAACYLQLEDFASAARASRQAVDAWDGWFFVWICFAQHLVLNDQLEDAHAAWARAKELFPDLSLPLYLSLVDHAPQSPHIINHLRERMRTSGLQ